MQLLSVIARMGSETNEDFIIEEWLFEVKI